jgi:Uma2 family endonuclease
MSAHPQHWITPEEYLEIERTAEFRHEYYNGRMYAMAGGWYWHSVISRNLAAALNAALRTRPCIVTTSDLRINVSQEGLHTYPDIAVVCGEPEFVGGRNDTLANPALIVEVLSPSTETYDRGFKAAQYRTLSSLQEYALIWQTEARVEVFRRREAGRWLLTEFAGLDAAANFESIDISVPLAEIYAKVQFGEEGT